MNTNLGFWDQPADTGGNEPVSVSGGAAPVEPQIPDVPRRRRSKLRLRLLTTWTAALLVALQVAAQESSQAQPKNEAFVQQYAAKPDAVTDLQYFTMTLPPGASLISAPLKTNPEPAQDVFLGLPSGWPLLFGWSATKQDWLGADEALAVPGEGFWVYVHTPTKIVVMGEPFGHFGSLVKNVKPGWHLVGVPFLEGIHWHDLQLYASGNHIGLATAFEMGWIDPNISTMQGSQVVLHAPGQHFQPGAAYWIKTTEPLTVRAERASGTASVPDHSLMLRDPAASESPQPSRSAASSTMGWLSAVAETLVDVAKGAALFAEGHWVAGSFEFAAGAFGLIEHGLGGGESGDSLASELTAIDGKLDALIVNVEAIEGQLTQVETAISGLKDHIDSESKLGQPLRDAEAWLNDYYTDHTKVGQSREWARWTLAGCAGALTCPSVSNPVSKDDYNAFAAKYMQHPGQVNTSSDDFPLWWAYGVIGNQRGGVASYQTQGTTADGFVTKIYQGLTDGMGTPQNGLVNYMEYVFSQSSCTVDISDAKCDLYKQVYQPVEAYFLKAIGYQTQLAAAVAESWSVLGQKDQTAWGSAGKQYMQGVTEKINHETEAFLQVAEQIALYRAADGRQDWGNFAATDAGILLARADFVAARLAGPNYLTNAPATYHNAPWPSSGVVGRTFYAKDEPVLSGTRGVCASANKAFCGAPAAQIGENDHENALPKTKRTATGDWPYLSWQMSAGSVQGTATASWTVQRLKPLAAGSLPNGAYLVNSTKPERMGANLVVATYDENYNNPPAPGGQSIQFASLSSVEGTIGRHGLKLGANAWTKSGGTSNVTHQIAVSFADNANAPGSGHLSVNYPTVTKGADAAVDGTWSATTNIKLDLQGFSAFKGVHLHWPASVEVNLTNSVMQTPSLLGTHCADNNYYRKFRLAEELLDSKGNAVSSTSTAANTACTSPFSVCRITGDQAVDSSSLHLTPGTQYVLKASYQSKVEPLVACGAGGVTQRFAFSPSTASWVITAPMLTLTKQ